MSTLQVQTIQGPTSGADSNTIRVADNHKLYQFRSDKSGQNVKLIHEGSMTMTVSEIAQ